MKVAVAVVVSMLVFAVAAIGLAFVFAPTRDMRALVAYLATLQLVAVGVVVANMWVAKN